MEKEVSKKWKREGERGFLLKNHRKMQNALLEFSPSLFTMVGKPLRQPPLICVLPGQKRTTCLTHEHCTSHTPFHDSLTTKFQLGAHQIFSGCRYIHRIRLKCYNNQIGSVNYSANIRQGRGWGRYMGARLYRNNQV